MCMCLEIFNRYGLENNISVGYKLFLTNKGTPAILDGGLDCES